MTGITQQLSGMTYAGDPQWAWQCKEGKYKCTTGAVCVLALLLCLDEFHRASRVELTLMGSFFY